MIHFVGDKAKGRISKRVFQENNARQIFRKTNISYQGVRKFVFQKTWRALFSWNTRFKIRPFAILPTNFKPLLRRQSYLIFDITRSNNQSLVPW